MVVVVVVSTALSTSRFISSPVTKQTVLPSFNCNVRLENWGIPLASSFYKILEGLIKSEHTCKHI